MDNRYNPLRYIADPSIQAYFTMALFVMWSAYFGVVAAYYMEWLGYSIVTSIWVHLAVVIPIMITNAVFREAEKSGSVWVKDYTNRKAQAYINKFHGKTAYTANQFHAGNVKTTTAIEDSMREHHLVIPNNVWDPTQPESHFESWIDEKLDAHIAFCNSLNQLLAKSFLIEISILN